LIFIRIFVVVIVGGGGFKRFKHGLANGPILKEFS